MVHHNTGRFSDESADFRSACGRTHTNSFAHTHMDACTYTSSITHMNLTRLLFLFLSLSLPLSLSLYFLIYSSPSPSSHWTVNCLSTETSQRPMCIRSFDCTHSHTHTHTTPFSSFLLSLILILFLSLSLFSGGIRTKEESWPFFLLVQL